jgi:hypothetical protein
VQPVTGFHVGSVHSMPEPSAIGDLLDLVWVAWLRGRCRSAGRPSHDGYALLKLSRTALATQRFFPKIIQVHMERRHLTLAQFADEIRTI